jgi:predicted acylesterase/phospholipase RssA
METAVSDALVLTGAAVKGAFTAGVLTVLSDPAVKTALDLNFRRVYGSSSGALNAAFYAALLRVGEHATAGERLVRVWIDDVTFRKAFSFSWRGIFGVQGLFNTRALVSLMRRRLTAKPGDQSITLGMTVTNAQGRLVGEPPATSYEQLVTFSDEDFDTEASLDVIRHVAAASASIPGLFVPMKLDVAGRTFDALDGGVVDDTPLSSALANHDVRRVFIVTPDPASAPPVDLRGLSYVSQVFDILVQQRVVRDLKTVRHRNEALRRLSELVPDAAQRAPLLDAIGWRDHHPVEIVEIRPDVVLPGQSFSGIFSNTLRQEYVDAGIEAGKRAMAGRGVVWPE